MLLEIICLVLFTLLIVYFVITFIVIAKYRKMKKLSSYLKYKYSVLNTKAFNVDKNLSLFDLKRVDVGIVYDSFISLYSEILEIESEIYRGDLIK